MNMKALLLAYSLLIPATWLTAGEHESFGTKRSKISDFDESQTLDSAGTFEDQYWQKHFKFDDKPSKVARYKPMKRIATLAKISETTFVQERRKQKLANILTRAIDKTVTHVLISQGYDPSKVAFKVGFEFKDE